MFRNKFRNFYWLIILVLVFLPIFGTWAQAPAGELPNPIGSNSFSELITKIVDAITPIAISIAVIMIIYAGFLFMTAGGNEDKVSTARKALIWSLVGLAVILIGSGFISIIEEILGT